MRYFKFAKWTVSAIAFLVIAALLVGTAMTVVDFYDGLDKEPSKEPIHEPSETPNDPETPENTEPDEDTENKYVINLSYALGTNFVEGLYEDLSLVDGKVLSQLYEKLTANIADISSVDGAIIARSSSYAPLTHALVKSGVGLSGPYAVGKRTVSVQYKIDSSMDPSIKDATIKIGTRDEEIDITAIELYMGYIIKNSEDGVSALCNDNGEILASDMGDKVPAYQRTVSGNPVFSDASGAYYVFDTEKSEFDTVTAEDILPSLKYDYPYRPYLNDKGEQIYVKYDSKAKKYKFYNAVSGKQVISAAYVEAYDFDQNGYVFAKSGSTNGIVDVNGKSVWKSPTSNYYFYPDKTVNQGCWVREYYERPYINDMSAMGADRVDEYGYVRVRLRLIGRSSSVYGRVVADYEALVDVKSGKHFEIPEGYTLEGYSDGVLLLSKNGRYGYYSIEGKWIAQPIYTYAEPFIQGLAVVGYSDGTRGMIDRDGNIVLPFAFSYVSNVSSGLVSTYSESGGWEIFKLVENASVDGDR